MYIALLLFIKARGHVTGAKNAVYIRIITAGVLVRRLFFNCDLNRPPYKTLTAAAFSVLIV